MLISALETDSKDMPEAATAPSKEKQHAELVRGFGRAEKWGGVGNFASIPESFGELLRMAQQRTQVVSQGRGSLPRRLRQPLPVDHGENDRSACRQRNRRNVQKIPEKLHTASRRLTSQDLTENDACPCLRLVVSASWGLHLHHAGLRHVVAERRHENSAKRALTRRCASYCSLGPSP